MELNWPNPEIVCVELNCPNPEVVCVELNWPNPEIVCVELNWPNPKRHLQGRGLIGGAVGVFEYIALMVDDSV